MNNYHNKEVSLDESVDLAIIVNDGISQNPFLKVGEFSQMAQLIISAPEYNLYNRNALEVYLEKQEERFVADNQRVEPSGTGI